MLRLSRYKAQFFLWLLMLKSATGVLLLPTHAIAQAQEVWVTIFVHGIMSIAPHVNLQNIGLFIRDEIIDTVYARTVHRMRKDHYFYQDQAMQGFGLLPIDTTDLQPGNGAAITASLYNMIDTAVYDNAHINYFYTYGWSGLLSRSQRLFEAEGLLLGLYQLIDSFKAHNITPKVRIIGYSHGGNVCLNIARIHTEKYPDMEIQIDELITIGMPLHVETDICVALPLFKKVYNIFSERDVIQTIDFFSCHGIFSGRKFYSRKAFCVPTTVTQIKLKVSRLKKSKMSKQKMRNLCMNPFARTARSGHRGLLRDASPGHLELWFFGWTADKYRTYFPLYPLPTVVFVPYITHLAEQYSTEICNPHACTIDLRPQLGYSVISQKVKRSQFRYQVPFIDEALFEQCKQQAFMVLPPESDNYTYQKKIDAALKEAGKEYDAAHPLSSAQTQKGCCRWHRRKQHKKARALPSHYRFLEPLS